MTKGLILALIVNLPIMLPAYGASFDCDRARGFIEKAICSDKQLSELDDALDESYRKALENADQPAQVEKDQKTWLTKARAICKTLKCLKKSHRKRIEDLPSVKQFYWKTFLDRNMGITFIYPINRSIRGRQNDIEISGFSMPLSYS